MAYELFVNDDRGLIDWCRMNQGGYVLNTNVTSFNTKSNNKIHRPSCSTLNNARHVGRMTIPEHAKICSNDVSELVAYNNQLPCSPCGTCLKGGYDKIKMLIEQKQSTS